MIPFWKVQSAGNDFVLLLEGDVPTSTNRCELAAKLCDRKYAIGGDGMLVLGLGDCSTLEMYNPDGTPDFCGNGLMSAVKFAQIAFANELTQILHGGRLVPVHHAQDCRVEVEIGSATFDPAAIPTIEGVPELFECALPGVEGLPLVSVVQTGSAHAVVFVDKLPCDDEFLRLSPLVEHHAWFPERVSLMWVQPVSETRLKMRIWERGAGETLGCGTGSAAAAVVYMRKYGFGGLLEIANPGGVITCSAQNWSSGLSLGSVPTVVFSGHVDLSQIVR